MIAAYLGWTLDAFDFFLMVFMFKDISVELHSSMQVVVDRGFPDARRCGPSAPSCSAGSATGMAESPR